MSEEFEDINEMVEEDLPVEEGEPSGRYDKLLGGDARKFKLSGMFKDWYLDYASYVILHLNRQIQHHIRPPEFHPRSCIFR